MELSNPPGPDERAKQGVEPARYPPEIIQASLAKKNGQPLAAGDVLPGLAAREAIRNESNGRPQGWPQPDPFEVRDDRTSEPPVWILPTTYRNQINKVSRAKQVATGAVMASLFGVLSSICAGRYRASFTPQYKSHSHLFLLLALPSAGGKSEAIKVYAKEVYRVQKRLRKAIQEANDRHAPERANLQKQIAAMESGSPEDYPGQLNEARERLQDIGPQPLPQYFRKDVSPQKIGVLYAKHQIVCVVMTESADWIGLIMGYGKDQGAQTTMVVCGFTVEPVGEDRITREESASNRPVLSLFLACQTAEVKKFIADPVARQRGLIGRTLVFSALSFVGKRLPYDQRPVVTDDDMAAWNSAVDLVTSEIPDRDDDGWLPLDIPVSAPACFLYARLFEVVEKRLSSDSPDIRLDDLEDVAGRSLEQVGRIAILLHVLWTTSRQIKPTEEEITEGTVFRAFSLVLWNLQGFLDMASASPVGGHQLALELWSALDGSPLFGKGFSTLKDWLRLGPNRWRSSAATEPQLKILEELGYLVVKSVKNFRGPASKVIELNPLARGLAPATVATVATVTQNPLFLEVIASQPHLRKYLKSSDGLAENSKPSPDESSRRNDSRASMSPAGKGSSDSVAAVATVAETGGTFPRFPTHNAPEFVDLPEMF